MIHLFIPAVRGGIPLAEFSATVAAYPSLAGIVAGNW